MLERLLLNRDKNKRGRFLFYWKAEYITSS